MPSLPNLNAKSTNTLLQLLHNPSDNVCTPCPFNFQHFIFSPSTILYPGSTNISPIFATPFSIECAIVITLNVLPGSYTSTTLMFFTVSISLPTSSLGTLFKSKFGAVAMARISPVLGFTHIILPFLHFCSSIIRLSASSQNT